ncbi:MAG: hypothetical protein QOD77_328 [Thermoplasmata archaeon]|nr:hypothetical protein [Thermoplasmata archaeon]
MRAERVILWMFVLLSIATAAALWWFIRISEQRLSPDDFARVRPRLYSALAGDLAAPVVAWFVLRAIGRRRAARSQGP